MAAAELPRSALNYKRLSATAAQRAVREARQVRGRGARAVAEVVFRHQVAQAVLAQSATALMLAEQQVESPALASLNPAGFTTAPDGVAAMLQQIETDWAFAQLVSSLVQDAGRAAQSVAQAARPRTGWTRVLTPPSCSRCAVLAGRVYRYSDGFLRHPGDDCTTIAVREGDDRFVSNPLELVRSGMVTGLSKADVQALKDGADFAQVVNVRRSAAGLQQSGRVLVRNGRPTPEGIYRLTGGDRARALDLLTRYGYLLP